MVSCTAQSRGGGLRHQVAAEVGGGRGSRWQAAMGREGGELRPLTRQEGGCYPTTIRRGRHGLGILGGVQRTIQKKNPERKKNRKSKKPEFAQKIKKNSLKILKNPMRNIKTEIPPAHEESLDSAGRGLWKTGAVVTPVERRRKKEAIGSSGKGSGKGSDKGRQTERIVGSCFCSFGNSVWIFCGIFRFFLSHFF